MAEQRVPARLERGTDGPKVIVAGVDGSENSWRAAAYAAGPARRQNALPALVYVRPYPAGGAAPVAPVPEPGTGVTSQLPGQIRDAVGQVGPAFPVRWEFHTFRGDPYNGLAAAADRLTADAVVVGASERAGHRPIGSVAGRLVKAGRRPVTVVP